MDVKNMVHFVSLPNLETVIALEEYNFFLKTIFVQKLKSITTVGGYSSVVCVNALKQINLSDEICQLINSVVIKIQSFSVYSGIIISQLLIKLWNEDLCEFNANNISQDLVKVRAKLEASLESMKTRDQPVNIHYLQTLVTGLLMEEPGILLGKEALNSLSLQIVKAALSNEGSDSRWTSVHVEEGQDKFFVVNGVLCEVDDINFNLIKSFLSDQSVSFKMLLFLEEIDSSENAMIIIEEIVKNNIVLVVCQKRVSHLAKVTLRRSHVITIERIGEEKAKSIEALTGAIPVKDFKSILPGSLATMIGHFSDFSSISSGRKNMVCIRKCGSCVNSLYVECRSFAGVASVKEVVSNALRFLHFPLSSPFYLPGPVSFEDSLAASLSTTNASVSQSLSRVIAIFINILEEISSLYNTSVIHKFNYMDNYYLKRNALLQSFDTVIQLFSLSRIIRRI